MATLEMKAGSAAYRSGISAVGQVKKQPVLRAKIAMQWLTRGVLILLLVAMIALGFGFAFFRMEISRLANNSPDLNQLANHAKTLSNHPPGVVVLTGDVARIATGLGLLKKGMGERVMISGVNALTSRNALFRAANYQPHLVPCCVDIGHAARNTRGNAVEVAHWAGLHRYREIWVVTSDYHMPRSLLELGAAMEGTKLYPFVAREMRSLKAGEADTAYQRANLLRHSLKEYGKYLAAVARIWLEGGFDGEDTRKVESAIAKSF